MRISNKGQLTSIYKGSVIVKKKTKVNKIDLSESLNDFSGHWYVKSHNVAKANNYDIVKTSMKNCSLQRKYGTSDFRKIEEIEHAKALSKTLDSLTIWELQNMITPNNEKEILKLIEKKIDIYNASIKEAKVEAWRKKRAEAEDVAKSKATTKLKLRGIYKTPLWDKNISMVASR